MDKSFGSKLLVACSMPVATHHFLLVRAPLEIQPAGRNNVLHVLELAFALFHPGKARNDATAVLTGIR